MQRPFVRVLHADSEDFPGWETGGEVGLEREGVGLVVGPGGSAWLRVLRILRRRSVLVFLCLVDSLVLGPWQEAEG